MLLRIGETVLNSEQVVRVCLDVRLPSRDDDEVIPYVDVYLVGGNRFTAPADSPEGLALRWWLTVATIQQRLRAMEESRSLALDLVALYRRQPQL